MDFSYFTYIKLLKSLQNAGYSFQTFLDFLQIPQDKVIILRHDVDLLPKNSLHFARIQHEHGITGSYYFRSIPKSWDEEIIKEIHKLGHEVGYHYENLTTCNGSVIEGIKDFTKNLKKLRQLVPVSTICMHGSPTSKWDNKDLWKHFRYKEYEIIGEPYFDINYKDVFYLTDTGRRWDGWKTSVRDKVPQQQKWNKEGLVFHSTNDIIEAADQGKLPDKIMMTFHPQRWHDSSLQWFKELVVQNAKNQVKRLLVKRRSGKKRGTIETEEKEGL